MIEKIDAFPENISRLRSHYAELVNSVTTMKAGEMIKFESEGEKKLNRHTILNMLETRTEKVFKVQVSGKVAYVKCLTEEETKEEMLERKKRAEEMKEKLNKG